MNTKGFIIIFNRYFFLFVLIVALLFYGYSYFNDAGYIKQGSTAYKAGKVFGLQPPNATLIEQEIFLAVNEQRSSAGLGNLKWNNQLESIAAMHSKDMYARNFFDHTNPDGDGPTERAKKQGISIYNGNWVGIAENIGKTPMGDVEGCGYVSSESDIAKCAIDGWMNSPGHRANILNKNYNVLGVGTYCTTSYCWNTQDFR